MVNSKDLLTSLFDYHAAAMRRIWDYVWFLMGRI